MCSRGDHNDAKDGDCGVDDNDVIEKMVREKKEKQENLLLATELSS